MPFEIVATLDQMHSHLKGLGYLGHVQIGEPMAPPEAETTAAIFASGVRVAETTLNSIIELHTITIRIYKDMLVHPPEELEKGLSIVTSHLMKELGSDLDLGGNIRSVDVAGIYGSVLEAQWGSIQIQNKMYKVVDITVPLIVDAPDTLSN